MSRSPNYDIMRRRAGGASSPRPDIGHDPAAELAALTRLDHDGLIRRWKVLLGGSPPAHLPKWLLERLLAYKLQAEALGELDHASAQMLERLAQKADCNTATGTIGNRQPARLAPSLQDLGLKDPRKGALKPGSVLVREHDGQLHHVMVLDEGFSWNGATFASLSQLAFAITGTRWNGQRFFGLGKRSSFTTGKPGRNGNASNQTAEVAHQLPRAGGLAASGSFAGEGRP